MPISPPDKAGSAAAEVARLMTICNACRYCEGLCAVFPAMELRRAFPLSEAEYLANLCHDCGACFTACQYAPPHEFAVNVPKAFSSLRAKSYARHVWPGFLAPAFAKNLVVICLVAAVSVALFIVGFVALNDAGAVFAAHAGAGAFYRLMPHDAMIGLFGAVFVYAVIAIVAGLRSFWRATGGGPIAGRDLLVAAGHTGTLAYLDGGGAGCPVEDERGRDGRKLYHHLAFYGFLLCLASTLAATLYHYALGLEAPYPWTSPVVILGTLGGVGLVIGPVGMMREKRRRPPEIAPSTRSGMAAAFLWMLLLNGVTGLALLALRETPAMGVLLALHLGFVFALFLSFPYGKFVHGFYRYAALVRFARETGGRAASHGG
ncbi:MAG: tricarballylate utilization 4Fe-4S protein TcuB [Hyphomicrobiales bacterium]|nr:tricarballylate utilization 4Fe-4S protein TcuB [Hyphomicrobiales bacterium]